MIRANLLKLIKNLPILLVAYSTSAVYAAPFEVAVAPSRFELNADNTGRVGQSLQIQNLGKQNVNLKIRTLDWALSEKGEITYYDELRPNSCRPWVTLERNSLSLPAQGKRAMRFQVNAPANTTLTECRFMIAVEGLDPAHNSVLDTNSGANLSIPVSGRIAVAVYIALNNAQPQLSLKQLTVQNARGGRVPFVTVQNTGKAHGRLEGSINATDAKGQAYELTVDNSPVLPGQTRQLALTPKAINSNNNSPTYPLKGRGQLDWAKGSFKINAEFK